jgi:hypothetical protein
MTIVTMFGFNGVDGLITEQSFDNSTGNVSLKASQLMEFKNSLLPENVSEIEESEKAVEESFESVNIPVTNDSVGGPFVSVTPGSSDTLAESPPNGANTVDVGNMTTPQDLVISNGNTSVPPTFSMPPSSGTIDVSNMTLPADLDTAIDPSGEYTLSDNALNPVSNYNELVMQDNNLGINFSKKSSLIGETSVASHGSLVFYTGNWYAAKSDNQGKNWVFVDPKEGFSDFCCDQRVLYDPTQNIFIWYRQGVNDKSTNENVVKIGVSSDLTKWRFFDLIPSQLDPTLINTWFDYPEMALSSKFLYITTNAFGKYDASAVTIRIPLTSLKGNEISTEYYVEPQRFTFTPANGMKDKMYWGTHLSNEIIRIYEWNDNQSASDIKFYDKKIDPWYSLVKGLGKCGIHNFETRQVQGNWCERADSRITSGWQSGKFLTFFWNADSGSRTNRGATFTWPYINAATFDITNNMSYVARPYLWNIEFPWLYGQSATDDKGNIGIVAFYGDQINRPSLAFGIKTDPLDTSWKMVKLTKSSSPIPLQEMCNYKGFYQPQRCQLPNLLDQGYKWGDYITIRSHNSSSWDIASYVFNNGNPEPHYYIMSEGNSN